MKVARVRRGPQPRLTSPFGVGGTAPMPALDDLSDVDLTGLADGDTIVFFRRGDVIATGDIIDTTRWPVIDTKRGGTVQGELDALNRLMDMTVYNLPLQWKADRTFLVPGHGHVYDKLDLLEYRDAVTIVRDRVQDLIDEGKTLAQVKAANPTLGYRSQYGADSGPWTTDMFVEVIYNELAAKKVKK